MRLPSFGGGLEVVHKFRPNNFKWKADGVPDVGFAAEEVEKIEPLFVMYNAKGEIEGVKYGQLTTVLVNAVKELKQENGDLKAQVQNQQSQLIKQLNQMQKQLAAMRTLICSQNPQSDLCK